MFEAQDPIAYLRRRLATGGRCFYMPNGGNLGDNLIASATVQRFEREGLPWHFIRGRRRDVQPGDLLVFGGGGSLVSLYTGGIECVASLQALGAPVVVLPHTVNGHPDFWRGTGAVTVFCREQDSLAYLESFPQVESLPAHDMALGLDLTADPFTTVLALREAYASRGEVRVLRAFRRDGEAAGAIADDTLDLSALSYPPLMSVTSVHGHACAFLAALAGYSAIHTDRLHVAIAGGLLGIPVVLFDNVYGKNRAVFAASLQDRFSSMVFEPTPPARA